MIACLRDLKKAIRLDSQNNEKVVLNALLEYDVIKTNIVPLILSFRNQRNDVSQRFILSCGKLTTINTKDKHFIHSYYS